jgi:hypothetical protein
MTLLQASLAVFAPGAAGEGQYPDWGGFLASGQDASGFLLAGFPAAAQDELLWQIRRSRWWNAWIALAPGAPSSRFECLADARQEPEAAMREMARMACDGGDDAGHMDFEERLLHFLCVRDGARLQPVCDRHSAYLYRFPLAEALGADEERVTRTLLDLQRRRMLEPGLPVDRVRHCTRCSSAHPHYFDVCPGCGSIQIAKTASCHCFACGHVGPEHAFVQGGRLACPQCHAALRHIGVDYDRPMSQYACADCRHVFMEPAVRVRCLDCGDIAQPDALDVRTIAPLQLSAQGRAALRQGRAGGEPALAGMPFASFRQVLAWTLANARPASLALLVLDFDAGPSSALPLGERRRHAADEAIRRVHELLCDADLSAVDPAHRLWLLVADADGLLAHVAAMQAPGGRPPRVARLALAGPGAPGSLAQLMARVEAEFEP